MSTFVKIRYNPDQNTWEDDANSYHYGSKVSRYKLIQKGIKFIMESKIGSIWYFTAYGTFGEVVEEPNEDTKSKEFRVYYDKINHITPTPNTFKHKMILEHKFKGEMAYTQSSILNISSELYDSILKILRESNWTTNIDLKGEHGSAFQLWIITKFGNTDINLSKSEATIFREFRNCFPHLSSINSDTRRNQITLISNTIVEEDSVKDCWQPNLWGCIQNQTLADKTKCVIECEYSPDHNSAKSCTSFGTIWLRSNNKEEFASNYLEVIDQQILKGNKIDFNEFCRYITNRNGEVPIETINWVKDVFNFNSKELNLIFGEMAIQHTTEPPILKGIEKEILHNLQKKKQVIIYGPPGTGKTYSAMKIAKDLVFPQGKENITIIQFHPNYTYQNFISGFFPEINDAGQIYYKNKVGHFIQIAETARDRSNENFCLIIDEFNRANLPKVMGELFYALEYRGENNLSRATETGTELIVPDNLYILGTMNTADRSLADIDVALRRRFRFIELIPDENVIWDYYKDFEVDQDRLKQLVNMFKSINDKLKVRLGNKDLLIGHSYFLLEDLEDNTILDLIYYELIPLLEDYFYQDRNEVRSILGSELYLTNDQDTIIKREVFDIKAYLNNFNK
ncbi:MAG: AAA family ATPase [Candidatus Heimdallarchaeota archaeon]|nr:AAA family ATPase [Candidatus Heimdallarchaeota archaeon]